MLMRRKKNILLAILPITFGLMLLFCNSFKVQAQGLSFSISPPLVEIMIKPGKTVTQTYKIANSGDTVIATFTIAQLTETGIKEDPNFAVENWIACATNDFTFGRPFLFAAGTERQLALRINPPPNTQEQDYYRALVLTTSPNPPPGSSMTNVSQQLAAPLIITVTSSGMVNKSAAITRFDVPTILDSFDPLKMDIEVQNTSKTYFRPVGKITLTGLIGKGEYPIYPHIYLAGQKKKLFLESQAFSSQLKHTLELPGLFLGKYQAEVDFALDESKVHVKQKKIFYALPWKAVVITLLLITFIFIIIRGKKTKIKG